LNNKKKEKYEPILHVHPKSMEVNGAHQQSGYPNIFFCVQQMTFMQVWNNIRVSKWWHHFWLYYPFKRNKARRSGSESGM